MADRDMGGALFRNDKQEGNRPHWRGDVTINGVKYELAAWEKEARNGKTFLSLKVSEFREQAPRQDRFAPAQRSVRDDGDMIPF